MPITAEDIRFLKRTFVLARRGLNSVSPNPAVGAVIVKGGLVIAEGWHRRAGQPHAEVVAIEKASGKTEGATLYVNLEPCCHLGRTPPCTDAIIAAGIGRVVACITDPNPKVNCNGIKNLRGAGLEVEVGHLAPQAERLNEVYLHRTRIGRPFIHVKAGLSLDGRIATAAGESRWITSERARLYAHRLRQRYDAILVGIGTVLADDPRLTVRAEGGGSIHRIVVDSRLRIPLDARMFSLESGGKTFIATTDAGSEDKIRILVERGVEIIKCADKENKVDLECLLDKLNEREITSVLVEGGGEIIAGFFRAGLVDKVTFVYAPKIIGGRQSVPVVGGGDIELLEDALKLRDLRCFRLGPDIAVEGYTLR
jgi:diaminohydroxyphosphoribosylaminopyrimidine deaminase/5-amino-6-(5-phosphoribosylamino)uracil reductase